MRLLFIIAPVIIFIAGCAKQYEDSILPDIYSPKILSTLPENNATVSYSLPQISITFSEKMAQIEILTSPSFSFTQKWNGNELIIIPGSTLSEGMNYSITVTTNSRDTANNKLVKNFLLSFRTSGSIGPQSRITFIVDDTTLHKFGDLYLCGSFNSNGEYDPTWNDGARYKLYDDGLHNDSSAGDDVWALQLEISVDEFHTYKWAVDDNQDTFNGYVKHKYLNILDTNPVVSTIILYPNAVFNYYDIEGRVTSSIFLRGEFNGWSETANTMQLRISGGTNIYYTSVIVSEGLHRYKYFVDSEWNKVNTADRNVTINYFETGVTNINDYYAGP